MAETGGTNTPQADEILPMEEIVVTATTMTLPFPINTPNFGAGRALAAALLINYIQNQITELFNIDDPYPHGGSTLEQIEWFNRRLEEARQAHQDEGVDTGDRYIEPIDTSHIDGRPIDSGETSSTESPPVDPGSASTESPAVPRPGPGILTADPAVDLDTGQLPDAANDPDYGPTGQILPFPEAIPDVNVPMEEIIVQAPRIENVVPFQIQPPTGPFIPAVLVPEIQADMVADLLPEGVDATSTDPDTGDQIHEITPPPVPVYDPYDGTRTQILNDRPNGFTGIITFDPTELPEGSIGIRPVTETVPDTVPENTLRETEIVIADAVPVPEVAPEIVVNQTIEDDEIIITYDINPNLDRALDRTAELRHDTKMMHQLLYMSMLRFVNRTWGRLSEVLDWKEAFIRNLRDANGRKIRDPRTLSEWRDLLAKLDNGELTLDSEGFFVDMLTMEITDRLIGMASRAERDFMLEFFGPGHPLNNMLGSPTTWIRRLHGNI